MQQLKKYRIAIAIVWGLILFFWPASSDRTRGPQKNSPEVGEGLYKTSQTKANFGLQGVRFYETTLNKPRWNIESKFAELHRKENYAFLQDVSSNFYAEATGNVVTTKSDYGRCQLDSSEVLLEGNVVVHSKRGYLFELPRLKYVGKRHEFYSDDAVEMKGPSVDRPSMTLRGIGLKADIDREYFTVKRNVVAQKKLRNSEWIKITSQTGEFHTEDQHAFFQGSVNSILNSARIQSDSLELVVSDQKELINARGNVVLHTKKRKAHADTALLEAGSSQIVLEGRASVDADDNQIRGRRILLYSDEDRVEVEQAEGRIRQ
jgi:LPS export ABC transporter protein LptC/lipopolysaccharide transport protein LptA